VTPGAVGAREIMREAVRMRVVVVLVALLVVASGDAARAATDLAEPCTGRYDWIQLTSSEWLKGELRRMRNRSIEFESDKLKSQSLKWKDVATVCVARVSRFVRSDRTTVQGIGHVRDGEVVVLAAIGEVTFPRADLLAILPGSATERDRWSLKASIGADVQTGNTVQSSLDIALAIRREDRVTRGEVSYTGSYGRTDGVDNLNQQRITLKLDYFLSRRFYFTIIQAPFTYDEFQNVALRATPGAGPGYRLFDLDDFECDIGLALAYQYLRYISVPPGQPSVLNAVAVAPSFSFKWTIVSDLDLEMSHYSAIVATNIGQTTNHTSVALSYEITNFLDLEITGVHDRTWKPVPNDLGQVPKKDDLRLIFGFALEIW